MLHSRAAAALPAGLGEAAPRPRPTPVGRATGLQQQLHSQARTRFNSGSSSKLYLSGGSRLQTAVEAAAASSGRRLSQTRCAVVLACRLFGHCSSRAAGAATTAAPSPRRPVSKHAELRSSPRGARHAPRRRQPTLPPPRLPFCLPAGRPPACAASSACSSTRGRPTLRSTRACSCCSTAGRTLVRTLAPLAAFGAPPGGRAGYGAAGGAMRYSGAAAWRQHQCCKSRLRSWHHTLGQPRCIADLPACSPSLPPLPCLQRAW
jgi:hypothetical protein